MRILRGLSSKFLSCGCLVGVYETYDAEVVNILDARSPSCTDYVHRNGNIVPIDTLARASQSDSGGPSRPSDGD